MAIRQTGNLTLIKESHWDNVTAKDVIENCANSTAGVL
jgi:hypothetical protein